MRSFALAMLVAFACRSRATEPATTGSGSGAGNTAAIAALAIVFNTQEIWVGNDEHEPDPNVQYHGVLDIVRAGLDRQPPVSGLPSGSSGMLIGFATGARVLVPMGPIERITGAALGTQLDYRGMLGNDVSAGVALALDELARTRASRKILVIINNGQIDDADRATLDVRKREAARLGIETYALALWSPNSSDATPAVAGFTGKFFNVMSVDALVNALAVIWRR